MAPLPVPPTSSDPAAPSEPLDRALMRADLLSLAQWLGSAFHSRLPAPMRRMRSRDSLVRELSDDLLAALEAPDDELIRAIDALGTELGAWRRAREPVTLLDAVEPLVRRVLDG